MKGARAPRGPSEQGERGVAGGVRGYNGAKRKSQCKHRIDRDERRNARRAAAKGRAAV